MAYTHRLLENIIQHHLCLTWLYYGIDIYHLDEVLLGNKWNDLSWHSLFLFVYEVLFVQSFSIWVKWLKYLLLIEVSLLIDFISRCYLVFLSCTTVPADWGAVFHLENSPWLLLNSKLCVILFIVADSVCLSLRRETETWFLVIVLVAKPLKAKGSGDFFFFLT